MNFVVFMRRILFSSIILMALPSTLRAEETDEEFGETRPGESVGNEDSDVDPRVGITEVTYSGSGCPQGSAEAVIADDKKTLSLLFSSFNLELNPGTADRAQKECRVQVELRTPDDIRATVVRVDYRGFNKLPQRSSSSVLIQRYSLLDLKTMMTSLVLVRRKIFVGPQENNFQLASPIRRLQQWSKCGEDFRLNVEVGLRLSNPGKKDIAQSALDSIDGSLEKKRAKYHLRWKKCSDGPRNRPPRPKIPRPNRPT